MLLGLDQKQVQALEPELRRLLIELNNQDAHKAHRKEREYENARRGEAYSSASLVLTSLATVNSGAIVAILALIGAMLSNGKVALSGALVIIPLLFFFVSLTLTIVAMFCAYFATLRYIEASDSRVRAFDEPYVRNTAESKNFDRSGERFRWSGIVFALLSLVVTICGAFGFANFAIQALAHLNH